MQAQARGPDMGGSKPGYLQEPFDKGQHPGLEMRLCPDLLWAVERDPALNHFPHVPFGSTKAGSGLAVSSSS